MIRTPTKKQDNSLAVDPNATSCPICENNDTPEMVECEECKNWFHFQCVGVDSTVESVAWMCQTCTEKSSNAESRPPPQPTTSSESQSVPQSVPSCKLCFSEDTVLMLQCEQCKSLYHYQCVGVNSSVGRWICHKCDKATKRSSYRSSTSSKRRSVLQLEKLAKEKAIRDKLIAEKTKLAEEQAKVDGQFLQKEYEIRDNMTDSEDDDIASNRTTKRSKIVSDWLDSTQPETNVRTSDPQFNFRELIWDLGASDQQLTGSLVDRIQSHKVPTCTALTPSYTDDLSLIPSKNVQFAHPLMSGTLNPSTGNGNPTVDSQTGFFTETNRFSTRPMTSNATQHQSEMIQPTDTTLNIIPSVLNGQTAYSSASQNASTYAGQTNSVPLSASTNYVYQPSLIPAPTRIVPTLAQSSVAIPSRQPMIFTPIVQQFGSISNPPQTTSTHQRSIVSSMGKQPFVPTSAQSFVSSLNPQQQLVVPTMAHQSTTVYSQHQRVLPNPGVQLSNTVPTYQQSTQNWIPPMQPATVPNPIVSSATTQQQFGSSLFQQPMVGSIVIPPQPTFGSTLYQQPMVTSNVIPPQPTFGSTSYQQPMAGSNVIPPQQIFGSNTIPQQPMLGQQPPPVNQWVTYDPELNPQQLAPTRLQLAARQSMPKDYPKFNGDPEKWSIFYNAYANCTTSCGLSNGENLSRLERCLGEPARKAVHNLLTRPEAVPDIIGTLKMLYGRPEASIDSQLKVITNEAPPKMHKMETFIDFAMSVRNVTSEIQKTGMWQYLWNPQLMQQLVDKLPYQMRLEWGQIKLLTPNVNLSTFSDWLYSRAQTACAVTLPCSSDKKSNSNGNGHINTHSKSSDSSKKNPSNPKNYTNSEKKACLACNGKSHDIYVCRKFLGMSLNEKWETVKNNKICRICLGNHHILRCESNSLCGESGCTIKHHRLLHNSTKTASTTTTNNENQKSKQENVHSAHQMSKIVILRRYIPVTLFGPNGSINVLAFLDDGSDLTLIENWVAQKLGLTGTITDLFLEWTAKIVRKEPNSKSVKLKISGTQNHDKQYEIEDVRTVKSLNLPPQTVDVDQVKSVYKFLRRIPIQGYNNETPKILIGLKHCKISTPLKIRGGEWDEPMAAKTLLGWEIHGSNAPSAQATKINFHLHDEVNDDDKLHRMVAQFFSLENFGVKKPEQTLEALSDKRARQLLEKTTRRIENGFETGLLWKYDDVSLPDSLPMAKRRLLSLEKRLEKDPGLATKFREKLHEYADKGYIRKLTKEEENETSSITWYLPLFPVMYPKKPGKIRLVWDAAAKVANISLNSMLLSGPDLLVSLQGVLYRFRQGAIVVTGDIREMFHQVAIRKQDQDSQRFLWREPGTTEIDVYVLKVMSFGATCSPTSAQYVKNRNALELVDKYPKAEEAIRTNTYVDDWLQAFDTEAEAENIANEVKEVYARGGFEIRNWLSNSSQVSQNLGANTDDEQKLCIGPCETQTERVLGMWWDVKQDAFTYSLRYNPTNSELLSTARRPTKREALRTLMSIYDPLGFLASYLVHLKIILQDMWRTGIKWDEQLEVKDDDDLCDRWSNWIRHLPEIEHIRIDRHYSNKINSKNPTKIELHVFVDAGEPAYATVAYFRIEDKDGVECSLVGGKTKVAPLKPLSTPKMELQAAVLGARFKNTILQNHTLEIVRTVIWSDSKTVLSWLRSDLRKYTQFVGLRVGEILETTTLPEWRWIPSELNPADDATKWKGSFGLSSTSRWFKGPEFLAKSEEFWPEDITVGETKEELRPKYVHVHTKSDVEKLPIKFEEALKWKRTMAFAIRFLNNVKTRLGKPGFIIRTGLLRRAEFIEGENALYRKAQWDEFAPEIQMLERKLEPNERRATVEKTSFLYRYSPYLDYAGVLRMRGRIDQASNISIDQKRPIILPTNHQITELIVNDYHTRYKHRNTETVINEIKQKFVIPRLRALYKRIRRACQHCKNATVHPTPPEMAQLPVGRLASFTRQYTYVGVDYAGPYKITQFRKSVKMWIVLFTCLTVRAVYIDCVESLTTDSCIMAITRFINRNGTPREFFSDRGTQFVGTDNELAREIEKIDHDRLNIEFTTCYTQWNFNPPYGQHMGGAWERLVGSMKATLDKILPKSHYPNHETFITALAEVENIINSRPLTFVSIEQDDQEALTPNHFLKGSSNGNKPPGIFPAPPATLRGNWRYAQQIANEFWRKWVKEYLPMITRRTKWFDDVKPIEVGDQVIIVDENSPRNMWDRGVVIEAVETEADGRIRRASVRTTEGIYTRPVSKLAVLDITKPEAKTLTHENLAGGTVTARNEN